MVARAAQADEAQRFPGPDHERCRPDRARDEALDLERPPFGGRDRLREGVGERTPDDHPHERGRIGLARRKRREAPAVAQHRDPVRNAEHLVEPVRHEDDPDPARAQAPQRFEEALDVGLRERRGRLVEDQDVRPDGERPADCNERTLRGRQRGDGRVRIEPAPHDRERFGGARAHAPP